MNKREEMLSRVIAIARRNDPCYQIDNKFFTEIPANTWFQKTKWPDLYFALIFNHDFVKAYFGIESYMQVEDDSEQIDLKDYDDAVSLLLSNKGYSIPEWQLRLLEMSLAEDPLSYLYRFADELDVHKPA